MAVQHDAAAGIEARQILVGIAGAAYAAIRDHAFPAIAPKRQIEILQPGHQPDQPARRAQAVIADEDKRQGLGALGPARRVEQVRVGRLRHIERGQPRLRILPAERRRRRDNPLKPRQRPDADVIRHRDHPDQVRHPRHGIVEMRAGDAQNHVARARQARRLAREEQLGLMATGANRLGNRLGIGGIAPVLAVVALRAGADMDPDRVGRQVLHLAPMVIRARPAWPRPRARPSRSGSNPRGGGLRPAMPPRSTGSDG